MHSTMSDDDRWPKFWSVRTAIWPREKETSGTDVVSEKISYAFCNVNSFPRERIMFQFWRPVTTTTGARVLSCSSTPFALSLANRRLRKYRSRSSLYSYAVISVAVVDDPMVIRGAPPAVAFLRLFPEVVLDLRAHKGNPLVDLALDCELTCFMMLPLFDEASCVGVIEVSVRYPRHLLALYNELRREVERVGLSIDRPKAISLPCKALPGDLNLARSQVAKALAVAVESHALTLGQVWNPYVNYHHRLKCRLLGKQSSYSVDYSDGMSLVKHFYYGLVYLPLRNGPSLVARTLDTRQPHLCRNIRNFTANKGLMAMVSANTKSTCFVLILRSSHTGDLDHVFEFFWPQQRDHLALMEALVLTLKEHLPSFKYDSGAQLGDQLLVVDVERSSSVKILPPDKRVSLGMKRKTRASVRMERESLEGQSALNQYALANIKNPEGEDDNDDHDDEDLVMIAVHKAYHSLFFLPSSPTFESLKEKINQEFELNPAGTYKIEYQVLPGQWYGLTDDTCLKSCISSYRASNNIDHIKLLVLAVED